MNAVSRPPRETPDERLDRQAARLRDLADMSMATARDAREAIERAAAKEEDITKPSLVLARATRSVISTIDAENNLYRKQPPRRAAPGDTRRAKLNGALLHAAKTTETDPARRLALKRDIPALVEDALVDDPEAETPIHVHLFALAARLGLTLDVTKLPDELIGMKPRIYVRDG